MTIGRGTSLQPVDIDLTYEGCQNNVANVNVIFLLLKL